MTDLRRPLEYYRKLHIRRRNLDLEVDDVGRSIEGSILDFYVRSDVDFQLWSARIGIMVASVA